MHNGTIKQVPAMRSLGCNIQFLATWRKTLFSGVFRAPRGQMTFRDVLDEMRLCFELPQANIADKSYVCGGDADS